MKNFLSFFSPAPTSASFVSARRHLFTYLSVYVDAFLFLLSLHLCMLSWWTLMLLCLLYDRFYIVEHWLDRVLSKFDFDNRSYASVFAFAAYRLFISTEVIKLFTKISHLLFFLPLTTWSILWNFAHKLYRMTIMREKSVNNARHCYCLTHEHNIWKE